MERNANTPPPDAQQLSPAFGSFADVTPRRRGGDDSLENSSPIDARSDEKVIAKEPGRNETGNAPYQAAANKCEAHGNDDDILEARKQKDSF